jgi:hypothetical protein
MVSSGNSYRERVSRLVGWGHWFAFFNIIAAMLISTKYISESPWPETLLGQLYLILSWVGHFGFLVFALYILVLFPLTFVLPFKQLFRIVAVCFATIGLTALLLDSQTYPQVYQHLNPVTWELLLNREQSDIATDLQQLFIVLPIIFLLQLALAEWIWRKQRRLSHKHIGRPIAAVFFLCFISSHLIYIWADAYFYRPVTSQKSNFPLSYPMTAKTFMEKHGLLDREEYLRRRQINENSIDLVNYPLEPLKFNSRGKHYNVLMVMVDNLRADALTTATMPATSQFAAVNQNYTNHYSASNDNYGVFGLFYGIPNSYADSIKSQGTSPLLLTTMEDKGYHLGLFSGNNFSDALYYETIFTSPEVTQQETENASDDKAIADWSAWLQEKPDAPWFSFIELTAMNHFEEYDDSKAANSAAQKLKAAYSQAAQTVDISIDNILATLDNQDMMDNTIVIITSNHGTEFNDSNNGIWGSNSNYSRYQLQVPFVMHWPGKEAKQYTTRSSHFDLSVTLLQNLLGVSSAPSEFSSGINLFELSKRQWILAGDAREMALITDESTTVVDKFGNYKEYDTDYQRKKYASPKLSVLLQGLAELKRFYNRKH